MLVIGGSRGATGNLSKPLGARNGHAKNPEKIDMWKGNLSTMDLDLGWFFGE